ncbi:MAG TPA: hypothetical protein DIS69_00060 [Moraxellaceae bacterium]|nr:MULTISPECIES: hypothetical protein [unclassified Moraxella]HCN14449.1 hypothetical protein [Moraxellaceae bacterium]
MLVTQTDANTSTIDSTLDNQTKTKNKTIIDLLALITDTMPHWKVHRCQVTDGVISQHLPMKFIYHYEYLSDLLKLQHPLNGQLLASFDRLLTREQFAQMLGIHSNQVINPWQIKFAGKLVVFYQQPDIALRLHWVNTRKTFEPIYLSSKLSQTEALPYAIDNAFTNWQITGVEIIQKNPQVELVYDSDDTNGNGVQSILPSTQFVPVPKPLANWMMAYFQSHPVIANEWLTLIKSEAQSYAQTQQFIAEP